MFPLLKRNIPPLPSRYFVPYQIGRITGNLHEIASIIAIVESPGQIAISEAL